MSGGIASVSTLLHTEATVGGTMRPIASDINSGGGALSIDWMRMTANAAKNVVLGLSNGVAALSFAAFGPVRCSVALAPRVRVAERLRRVGCSSMKVRVAGVANRLDSGEEGQFNVGARLVGTGHPCFVVAEVAQAHDGSLGTAHAFVDAAASTGVDAVKFQTHIAAAESTPAEPWRVRFSPQDDTRYGYWTRMEFSESQWRGLRDHCHEAGVEFLSSAFSAEAVDMLDRLGMAAWKVASGEVSNVPLLDAMLATKKPMLCSSGMSALSELDDVVSRARAAGTPIAILQCTSSYPSTPETVGLNLISEFRERWKIPTGLSDHSGTIYPGLAAAAQGASLVEIHITLSRAMFGPDVSSSVTPEELRALVEGIRFIETCLANPVDKDARATELAPMRALFTKSIVATSQLSSGTVLRREHLAFKKPGTGLPASRVRDVVGRTLVRDLQVDELLAEEHLA